VRPKRMRRSYIAALLLCTTALSAQPTRPPAFDHQGITIDDLVDFTPEIRARAVDALKGYRLGAMYQPPSLAAAPDGTRGTIILPGVQGGAQWEHGASDPETGLLYVGSATQPSLVRAGEERRVRHGLRRGRSRG
jgi:hypothetical protein